MTMRCIFPQLEAQAVNVTWIYKDKDGEHFLWFSASFSPMDNKPPSHYLNYFSHINRGRVTSGRFVSRGVHMIELPHVTEIDEGEYSCPVENQHITTTFSKMLNVTGKMFSLFSSINVELYDNLIGRRGVKE